MISQSKYASNVIDETLPITQLQISRTLYHLSLKREDIHHAKIHF